MRLPRLDEACPILDPGMVEGLREVAALIDDDQFIAGLVDRFVDEAAPRLEAITRAVAREDATAMAQQAHTLVNSAGAIGALRVCTAARQLDTPTQIPEDAAAMVAALARELDAAVEACGPLRLTG